MLFMTNRAIKSSTGSLPRRFQFLLDENAPKDEMHFCTRSSEGNYKDVGKEKFISDIKNTGYEQIFIFIHGFNNLPEDDIFQDTEAIQQYFDRKKKGSVLVIPLIWPCDDDWALFDYFDDRETIEHMEKRDSIGKVLDLFSDDGFSKDVNILAHSMGNRVLRAELKKWKDKHKKKRKHIARIFKNIFLIASDMENETLEVGQGGEAICESAKNVVVYYADDDLALKYGSPLLNAKLKLKEKISELKAKAKLKFKSMVNKLLHRKEPKEQKLRVKKLDISRMLGQTGPDSMSKIPNNVYAIDCDKVNNLDGGFKGHTYFVPKASGENVVLNHMLSVLTTNTFSEGAKVIKGRKFQLRK